MLRGQLAGLAATMMRILDNCRQATEGMLYVAQWAREARDGAGYTHGMCTHLGYSDDTQDTGTDVS
jgi:hypothetical protein